MTVDIVLTTQLPTHHLFLVLRNAILPITLGGTAPPPVMEDKTEMPPHSLPRSINPWQKTSDQMFLLLIPNHLKVSPTKLTGSKLLLMVVMVKQQWPIRARRFQSLNMILEHKKKSLCMSGYQSRQWRLVSQRDPTVGQLRGNHP